MKKVQGKHKIQESRWFHKEKKWQAEVTPIIWKGKQSSEETTGTKAQGLCWFQIKGGAHQRQISN